MIYLFFIPKLSDIIYFGLNKLVPKKRDVLYFKKMISDHFRQFDDCGYRWTGMGATWPKPQVTCV